VESEVEELGGSCVGVLLVPVDELGVLGVDWDEAGVPIAVLFPSPEKELLDVSVLEIPSDERPDELLEEGVVPELS
jgi:hypothetical protein